MRYVYKETTTADEEILGCLERLRCEMEELREAVADKRGGALRLLTIEEAAERLGVEAASMELLQQQDAIQWIDYGGRSYFLAAEVDALKDVAAWGADR